MTRKPVLVGGKYKLAESLVSLLPIRTGFFMATTIQEAIAKARAYGNGSLNIPGKKAYRDAIYKYSKLSLEDLNKLLDKADEWLAKNSNLKDKNTEKWVVANAKLEALREAHAKKVGEQLV